MNTLIKAGIAVGVITMAADRYFWKVPGKLAVILYLIALAFIITGMIRAKTNQ